MNNASEFGLASIGLPLSLALSSSALPDAPVVPDSARESLVTRVRRTIAIARRGAARPAPALTDEAVATPV